MRVYTQIRSAINKAKVGLQNRKSEQQSKLAADASQVAIEVEVLDKHAALVNSAEHLTASYNGVLANLEAALKENPIRTVVGNLRGFTFPGCEAVAPLAAYDAAKRFKAEILAELRAQTVEHAEAQLAAFESEHKAVLARHGVL